MIANTLSARRIGFTLIELLVVIAIIGILAAILFPVFSAARDKARQTACLNNEKQLALAMLQYEQDYDEMVPIVVSQNATNVTTWPVTQIFSQANHWGWIEELYPYIKSAAVFICPSDAQQQYTGGSSYGINRYLGWTEGYDPFASNTVQPGCGTPSGTNNPTSIYEYCEDMPYMISKIPSPATKVEFSEFAHYTAPGWSAWTPNSVNSRRYYYSMIPGRYCAYGNFPGFNFLGTTTCASTAPCQMLSWHETNCNIVFCDGHAKAISFYPNQVPPDTNNPWIPLNNNNTGVGWMTYWYPNV